MQANQNFLVSQNDTSKKSRTQEGIREPFPSWENLTWKQTLALAKAMPLAPGEAAICIMITNLPPSPEGKGWEFLERGLPKKRWAYKNWLQENSLSGKTDSSQTCHLLKRHSKQGVSPAQ